MASSPFRISVAACSLLFIAGTDDARANEFPDGIYYLAGQEAAGICEKYLSDFRHGIDRPHVDVTAVLNKKGLSHVAFSCQFANITDYWAEDVNESSGLILQGWLVGAICESGDGPYPDLLSIIDESGDFTRLVVKFTRYEYNPDGGMIRMPPIHFYQCE